MSDERIVRGVGFTFEWYVTRLRYAYGYYAKGDGRGFVSSWSYTLKNMGFIHISAQNKRNLMRNIEPRFTTRVGDAPHRVMSDLLTIETMYYWALGTHDRDLETVQCELVPSGSGLLYCRPVITAVKTGRFATLTTKTGEQVRQWSLF